MFWHDLSYLHFPNHVSFLTRLYYRYFVPLFLKKADRVITFSQYSKKEVVEKMEIPAGKISVSSGAARNTFLPINEMGKTKIKNKIANGKPYFLYVGALQPRKNVDGIIKAFDIFKNKTGSDFKLILLGRLA